MLNASFGGSDVDNNTGDSCETDGCGVSSDCRESVDCGRSGNFGEFGDFGESGGGENDGSGEAGGGGKPDSWSTLRSKLSRLDCFLEKINCED